MARGWRWLAPVATLLVLACAPAASRSHDTVRIAVFNIRVLSTAKILEVDSTGKGINPQLIAAAEIIQRVRPDILLLNELWHDYATVAQGGGLDENARRFVRAYLNRGDAAIDYPYTFAAPCNTGKLSGFDLNGDGVTATPADTGTAPYADDSWGWGMRPGEFSIGVLSRYPIDAAHARTFRTFLWKDLPGNHMPQGFYPAAAVARMPLSSKSHWDLPVRVGTAVIHVFASVPTPGIFDGPEDRNGRRNFDEIRFWTRYIDGDSAIYDDSGQRGGFDGNAPFVIVGDLNAYAGQDTRFEGKAAIAQLLEHARVQDTGAWMTSSGALMGAMPGPPDFPERRTLIAGDFVQRFDYVLPSRNLKVVGGGVYWPSASEDSVGALRADAASDHRLGWVDVRLGAAPSQ